MPRALPPATRALLAAGRSLLHPMAAPIAPPVHNDQDVAAIPEYARRHGMVAVLPELSATWGDRRDVRDDASRLVREHALAALRDTADVLTIAKQLAQSNIEFVVLKGPVFSAWLYGDAGRRRSIDVDVLVHEHRRRAALQALEQIGFLPRIRSGAADMIYAGVGACPLSRSGSIGVDLHWRLCAKRFPMPLTAAAVLQRTTAVRFGDFAVPAPSPTDAAVLALLHAAKHVWYALELVLAIAALMTRDDVDWIEAHRLVTRAHVVRPAAAGLRLAAELFGATVPAPFAGDIKSNAVDRLCECAWYALSLPPGIFVSRSLDRRAHLAALDRWRDRVQYDARRLLEPTRLEWEWVKLPAKLTPLYVPLRVLRLALRAAGTVRARP